MSAKFFLRLLILGCFVVLVFLAVEVITQTYASASIGKNTDASLRLVGSDWIERHPSVPVRNVNYYVGSDWIERHPSVPVRNANYYVGSDWIERHPTTVRNADFFVGSDWVERHPETYYKGSDWVERNPGGVLP